MTEAQRHRVAIVDDDDSVRKALRSLLEVTGHLVVTFASAAEFLEAELRGLACVILDHHMPHMTGLELAGRLRDNGARIPMLLITGSPSAAIVARAAELGITRVLEKPVGDQDLLDFVSATRP